MFNNETIGVGGIMVFAESMDHHLADGNRTGVTEIIHQFMGDE